MASDPFATSGEIQDTPAGPFVTFSLKPSGSYDASLVQVRGTLEEVGNLIKVDVSQEPNPLWTLILRWNDLARAVQKDEAAKQAASGKA
jgi:hypothetical protein